MGKWYVMLVLAVVLVHAAARDVPGTKGAPGDATAANREHTNVVVNVPSAAAPTGEAVKDKKCDVAFAGIGGVAGVGGLIPLGGAGGLGGVGGLGGLGGLGGAAGGVGGVGGYGGVGGLGGVSVGGLGGAAGGVGGVGGGILP